MIEWVAAPAAQGCCSRPDDDDAAACQEEEMKKPHGDDRELVGVRREGKKR